MDKNGVVIAGNKTLEAVAEMGLAVEAIQTDGTRLVVVQRTDLDLANGDTKARELAYADNRAGELSLGWDADQIAQDLDAGVDLEQFFTEAELKTFTSDNTGGDNDEPKTCPHCGLPL